MKSNYSILVNTCDKFSDCWDPFFKLWSIYWKDCNGSIYLNTEFKEYSYQNLDIKSLRVCAHNNFSKSERATWSQCLKWALDMIKDEVILYMQEDYFLKDKVKNEWVERYVTLMHENPSIKCIHLTDQAVKTSDLSEFENLLNVPLNQRYRVSCQAALWRKSELSDLIRVDENAWEFEEFGSRRSAVLKKDYYSINKSIVQLDKFEIIPYIFTGIIQGRWYDGVVPLFEKHNIYIEYSKRGFVKDALPKPFLKRVSYRLNKWQKIYNHQKVIKRLKSLE